MRSRYCAEAKCDPRLAVTLRGDKFLAAALLVILSGALPGIDDASGAPADKSMNFTAIECDELLKGPDGKRCWLIQSPGEWKWVANQYSKDPDNSLMLPLQTDFKKHTVVVVDHGLATTAVHLATDAVVKSNEGLVVENSIRIPGPGVASDGKAHRLMQVIRCDKTTGPLVVKVQYQEYDNNGFIRTKNGAPPGRDTLLNPSNSEKNPPVPAKNSSAPSKSAPESHEGSEHNSK